MVVDPEEIAKAIKEAEARRQAEADKRAPKREVAADPTVPPAPSPVTQTPQPTETPHDPAHAGHIESSLPRLRTFADDLSGEMKKRGTTLTSIVQAERERAARELSLVDEDSAPRANRWKNPVLLVGALALVVVGAGAVVGAYVYTQIAASEERVLEPSIIFPNKIVTFDVPEYLTLADALAGEREQVSLSLGEIERVEVTLAGATTTPRELLAEFGAPPVLLREAKSVMFGVHSFDRNQPFVIIEVTQYDRSYGGMLEWEEDLGRALGNFFKPRGGTVPPTTLFTDKVIQNIDTRVSQDEWPILYAFPRRDVLVITTNQYTLSEILTRLNAQKTGAVLP